ncbi:hypothetical protein L208DRAFT_1402026 [Tricholoma matsutake]|nr:hypothetical protein L208DRAFT_1402026 [Tricholoma matsutake 945]
MFVRTVPQDQQDLITKSATLISHAISQTTYLLLTTITTTSNYFLSHSTPSRYDTSKGSAENPPPLPPRALVFLTSERTRNGLAAHAVSRQVVRLLIKLKDGFDDRHRGTASRRR